MSSLIRLFKSDDNHRISFLSRRYIRHSVNLLPAIWAAFMYLLLNGKVLSALGAAPQHKVQHRTNDECTHCAKVEPTGHQDHRKHRPCYKDPTEVRKLRFVFHFRSPLQRCTSGQCLALPICIRKCSRVV